MRPLDPALQPARHPERPAARRRRKRELDPETARERRRDARFPLANTEIRNHAIAGRVLDLSRGGMAIEVHTALSPGRRYGLTLTIGEHTETLEARVLWCRLRTTRRLPGGEVLPVYHAGIQRVTE